MERAKKRIAILGGGISGLTAAYEVQKAIREEGLPFEYILLEERSAAGGMIKTIELDGKSIDMGASSFDIRRADIRPFLEEIGLLQEIQYTIGKKPDRFSGHEFVHVNKPTYHGLPLKPAHILYDGELSWGDKFAVLVNQMFNSRKLGQDLYQTTKEFIDYRFGKPVTDYVAYPHYPENAYGSLEVCPPALLDPVLLQLFEYTDEQRPLGKEEMEAYRDGPGKEYSLIGGMETLVKCLYAQVKCDVEEGSAVTSIERIEEDILMLEVNQTEYIRVGSVISTLPLNESFKLLQEHFPEQNKMPAPTTSGMGTILFQYPKGTIQRHPQGYGFVIPKMSAYHTTKATILNRKWPAFEHADAEYIVVEFGRKEEDTLIQLPDADILKIIEAEVADILKINLPPTIARVYRWPNAVPHLEPTERIQFAEVEKQWSRQAEGKGIYLGGNGLHGYGLQNAVMEGKNLARRAIAYMRERNGLTQSRER